MSSIVRARFESEGWSYIRPGSAPNAPLLVAIHGYAQELTSWLDYAVSLVDESWTVLVPAGPSSFYVRSKAGAGTNKRGVAYGWVAHRDRTATDQRNAAFIAAAMGEVARTTGKDADRVSMIGYSQGVGVAMHAAQSLATSPVAFVGLAGGVPKDARAACAALRGVPTLWVSGTKDASYPPDYMHALVDDLESAGLAITHHAIETGHDVLEPARSMAREWLLSPDYS